MFEVFKRKDVSKYKYGYCYEFCPNCYAYEWPQLWPLIDFAWVCDFVNVRFSKSMAQSRIHRKNTRIANSLATLPPCFYAHLYAKEIKYFNHKQFQSAALAEN